MLLDSLSLIKGVVPDGFPMSINAYAIDGEKCLFLDTPDCAFRVRACCYILNQVTKRTLKIRRTKVSEHRIRRKKDMNQNRQILYLLRSCDDSVQYFKDRLSQSGLQVLQTFDLHETGRVETACTCPNHGTQQCDCQMVILLVYDKEDLPVSLVVHGHNGQTWLSLVESFGQTNIQLEAEICKLLTTDQANMAAGKLL